MGIDQPSGQQDARIPTIAAARSRARTLLLYHYRCHCLCRTHITPTRHHVRTSTRYGCLLHICYHTGQHKLTPSSITPPARTRSLRYVRCSTMEARKRAREGRIDENDEIESLGEREGKEKRIERIRGKFCDARRSARRHCRVVAVGTNTKAHQFHTSAERVVHTLNLHGHKLPSSVTLPSMPPRLSACILRRRQRDTNIGELRTLDREKG